MRVVVTDIAASTGGALTILKQFYRYIRENCKQDQWIFLLCDWYIEETENIKVITLPEIKRSHLRKIWFDCVGGRKFINALKPDVVLSLQNIITFGIKAPQVVYIHQSIPFQGIKNFSLFKRRERSVAFIQKIIGRFIYASVRKADAVVVQTNWMKDAVAKNTGCNSEKITVARPDFESPPALEEYPAFSPHRFFYPTANSLYKNNQLIVEACNILYKQGITDFLVELTLPKETINHPAIQCVGYLNREELFQHYSSSVLLFPSYIETVGLPLLDASAIGTPIIAADTPHAREILQKYHNYSLVPPFEAKQLANAMVKAMGETTVKSEPYHFSNATEWTNVIERLKSLKKS